MTCKTSSPIIHGKLEAIFLAYDRSLDKTNELIGAVNELVGAVNKISEGISLIARTLDRAKTK